MYKIARTHLPNEFGGILMGYRGEDNDIIIDFDIPELFVQSKTGFTRFADNLNKNIANSYDISKGIIEYLGEWHTHPFSNPGYSTNDLNSMREISEDEKTKNSTPILIILGLNETTYEHNVYQYCSNNLLMFIK